MDFGHASLIKVKHYNLKKLIILFLLFSYLTKFWNDERIVYVALTPCHGLAKKEWLYWSDNSLILTPLSVDVVSSLNLNYNSRVYFLNSNLSLFEIFKYQLKDTDYVQGKIGKAESNDFIIKSTYIWERRSNLNSIHLDIIYANYHPLMWRESNSASNIKGLYADIFFALHQKMRFHFSLHEQENSIWGLRLDNGSYTGLFGQIQNGKVNWSITGTTRTMERSQLFDFSIPILSQARKLVTRKPLDDFDTLSYFSVFSLKFWFTIIVSGVALIFIMYWILRLDQVEDEFQSNRFMAALSFTLSALFCREIVILDVSWSGKILCLVVVFWGFLISVSYNAILTSVLAASTAVAPINSLEELLLSKDYTLILPNDGAIRDFFKRAPFNSTGNIFCFPRRFNCFI